MATEIQIIEVRNNIGQPVNASPWTDEYLSDLIDAYGIDEASAKSWEQKAASVADMQDISEGGSTRKSVHAQYLKMVERFRSNIAVEIGTQRAPKTREAVRQ